MTSGPDKNVFRRETPVIQQCTSVAEHVRGDEGESAPAYQRRRRGERTSVSGEALTATALNAPGHWVIPISLPRLLLLFHCSTLNPKNDTRDG